jgi:hypothetical protein
VPDTHGGLYGLELFYRKELTALFQRVAIGHGVLHDRIALSLGHGLEMFLVVAAQE